MTEKRNLILAAMRDLIYEHGLQSVSMAQVKKRAGVGMGTVYNYFESKEELVNVLYSDLKKQMSAFVLQEYDGQQPIQTRFIAFCTRIIHYGIHYPVDFHLMEQLTFTPYIHASYKEDDFGLEAASHQLITDAKAEGLIKDFDNVILESMIYGIVSSAIHSHNAGKFNLTDEVTRQIVLCGWDAIKQV